MINKSVAGYEMFHTILTDISFDVIRKYLYQAMFIKYDLFFDSFVRSLINRNVRFNWLIWQYSSTNMRHIYYKCLVVDLRRNTMLKVECLPGLRPWANHKPRREGTSSIWAQVMDGDELSGKPMIGLLWTRPLQIKFREIKIKICRFSFPETELSKP